jgi:probable F420-dependent oxidoreductase
MLGGVWSTDHELPHVRATEVVTEIGLCLPQLGAHVSRDVVRAFCEKAEDMGFTSLWVQEHLFYPNPSRSGYGGVAEMQAPIQYHSVWGALELLAAAAAWTGSCGVGTSVLVGGYHRPIELAKALATIDQISGGRLTVGLGIGWSIEEHEQSGTAMAVRGRRMDELIVALRACFGPDPVEYRGAFFDIPPSIVRPKPVQQAVRFISGMWSEPGRERTARLFDGWNPAGLSVPRVSRWRDEMNASRPDGMPPLTVHFRCFVQSPFVNWTFERFLGQVRAARQAGFEEIIIDANFWDRISSPDDWIDALSELAPVLEAA